MNVLLQHAVLKVNPLARWETPSLVFLVFFGLWQRRWRSWIVFISPRHGHSPRREVRLRDNVGHNSCCLSLLSTKISITPRKGIFEPLKHLYYKESSPLTNKNISVYREELFIFLHVCERWSSEFSLAVGEQEFRKVWPTAFYSHAATLCILCLWPSFNANQLFGVIVAARPESPILLIMGQICWSFWQSALCAVRLFHPNSSDSWISWVCWVQSCQVVHFMDIWYSEHSQDIAVVVTIAENESRPVSLMEPGAISLNLINRNCGYWPVIKGIWWRGDTMKGHLLPEAANILSAL